MTKSIPLWQVGELRAAIALEHDLSVDVLVVGAGITGATAALALARQKLKVAVVEARTVCAGVTGSTTAHVTAAVDPRYVELTRKHGRDAARLVAASSSAAIEHIAITTERESIACDLARVPAYLYSEDSADRDALADEQTAARAAGLAVTLETTVPLPFRTIGAVRYADQLRFHPVRYVDGVLTAARAAGAQVYCGTRVVNIAEKDNAVEVKTDRGNTIHASAVFCATHVPLNTFLVQTKLGHYQSYAVAFEDVPLSDALFFDMTDPYHYIRRATVDGRDYLIVGGEDHRTGEEEDTEGCFTRLIEYSAHRFGTSAARYRWSAQVIEPIGGLPFIGRNASSKNVYIATGFSGNGMTYGTTAGLLVTDLIRGVDNPYADLYQATRVEPKAIGAFVEENLAFPRHLVVDRLKPADVKSTSEIGRGQGRTLKLDGKRLGVYRDDEGALHAVSAVCTHMHCILQFNDAERSWDCGCHGARFDVDGAVLQGPAVKPLEKLQIGSAEKGARRAR